MGGTPCTPRLPLLRTCHSILAQAWETSRSAPLVQEKPSELWHRPCLRLSLLSVVGVISRSLTMSAVSSTFLSTLLYALMEERHFALVDGLRFQPGLALNRWGQKLSPTQPSLRSPTAIKIPFIRTPLANREQDAQSLRR